MLHNIDTMSLSNAETTLNQRCTTSTQPFLNVAQCRFNVSTLHYNINLNVSESYIKTNLASEKYGFAEN